MRQQINDNTYYTSSAPSVVGKTMPVHPYPTTPPEALARSPTCRKVWEKCPCRLGPELARCTGRTQKTPPSAIRSFPASVSNHPVQQPLGILAARSLLRSITLPRCAAIQPSMVLLRRPIYCQGLAGLRSHPDQSGRPTMGNSCQSGKSVNPALRRYRLPGHPT